MGTGSAFIGCGVEQFDAELGATDVYMPLDAGRTTYRVGGVAIRLLSPRGTGPLARVLTTSGEGPYQLSLTVGDLDRAYHVLERAGVEVDPLSDESQSLLTRQI